MKVTEWNGDKLLARVIAAEHAATDETTSAAADIAESIHPWKAHKATGLESQVISEPAEVDTGAVVGRFGTTRRRGFYGLFLEKGWEHADKSDVVLEFERPFLRPAGDLEFPLYPPRLKLEYEKRG